MKKIVMFFVLLLLPIIVFAATGWYNDFLDINKNNTGDVTYWIGGDPYSGTQFDKSNFGNVLSLVITSADMKYWSDSQDRTGGAFNWQVTLTNETIVNGPYEVIWSHISIGGNDYQGTWSGSINVLEGLSASTDYKLAIWAKSWGSDQGDSWLSNGGANYVATFHTDATLPVELSTFTAQYLAGKPLLYWTTQSETDNMGWFVYRNKIEDFTSATKVSGMIEGHGTTTQAQSYIYEDVIANPQVDDVYYYWLESIDYSGTIHHFDKVAMITIPETNDPNQNITPPQVYDLLASPNPFNESTKITFTLTQSAMVDVAIYDVKGGLVKSFNSLHITADDLVSLQWDGKDENGKSLSNGIYLYSLKVNGQDYATKQVILMK